MIKLKIASKSSELDCKVHGHFDTKSFRFKSNSIRYKLKSITEVNSTSSLICVVICCFLFDKLAKIRLD